MCNLRGFNCIIGLGSYQHRYTKTIDILKRDMTIKSKYKISRMKAQTILRVAIVDVAVAERSPGA